LSVPIFMIWIYIVEKLQTHQLLKDLQYRYTYWWKKHANQCINCSTVHDNIYKTIAFPFSLTDWLLTTLRCFIFLSKPCEAHGPPFMLSCIIVSSIDGLLSPSTSWYCASEMQLKLRTEVYRKRREIMKISKPYQ
jgi:hypothetical protein